MKEYYLISINQLVDTFSRLESGKEFDFSISTNEEILNDSTIDKGDVLIVSIEDKVYFKFEVIDNSNDELKLRKVFEIEKSIHYNINIQGSIFKIDESDYYSICYKLFSDLLSENSKDAAPAGSIENTVPRNKIIYGAPGTGKSYELRDQASNIGFEEDNIIRITFHPNYSYQQFVGSYKPSPIYKNILQEGAELYGSDKATKLEDIDNKEPLIDYRFVAGPLMKQLVYALKNPDKNYLLIIEEINRASVSAVFGDVFQLLDRKSDGSSEYSITFNEEAMSFLRANGILNTEIKLPNNFFIWATMNSADQGVMPLDAAFKRRWAFEYLPLNEKESKVADSNIRFQGQDFNWNSFRKQINDRLKELGIVEDKLIGPFFMNSNELSDENSVKNKLLLYLRDDVVRHNPESLFKKRTYSDIIEMYSKGENIFVNLEIKTESIPEPQDLEQDS